MPTSLPQKASLAAHPAPYRRTILARTRPILVGHAVELATAQPPPATTAKFKSTPRLAQHRLRRLRDEAPTQADDEPVMDAAGDHADPAIPAIRLPAHRRAPGPHFGRTQRTRQRTDTGRRHRTAGQRTPGRSDARTGHWTLDTGHRTLAEDVDRVTTARPASGPPAPLRRATARWTPNRVPVDSPCRLGGEAAFQREIASLRQLLGRSAGVERRLGALLSSDEFRVERRANGDASSVMASRLAGLLLVVTYGRAARL